MGINDDKHKLPTVPQTNNNLPLRGYTIVVGTCGDNNGIGRDNAVPWHVPEDMKFLSETTKTTTGPSAATKINAVIVGRKTYESVPTQHRPFVGRLTIVLTTNESWNPQPEDLNRENRELIVVRGKDGLKQALEMLAQSPLADRVQRVFNLGGGEIYKQCKQEPYRSALQCILQTEIDPSAASKAEGDNGSPSFTAFFPPIKGFGDFVEECDPTPLGDKAKLRTWVPCNTEEMQYCNMIRDIMAKGSSKEDRTGVGTLGIFGTQMRFSLRDGRMPLLTTKRVFWKGVCEELLWFLRGETDSLLLEAKNVNIWKGNGSREFLDSRGLKHHAVGDLGPVYGFQWRHFGADYDNCHSDYDGKGIDQIKRIIETLKTNPNDRRMLLSAWNPCAIDKMALPPCHVLAQFYADTTRNELSCQLYQRSCDMGLGVPFNIASYSLLTILICRATGFKPGDFVHTLGDAHVYKNHIEPLQEQLKRVPRAFPFIRVVKDRPFLEDYQMSDFEIMDYLPYPTIQMEMAV